MRSFKFPQEILERIRADMEAIDRDAQKNKPKKEAVETHEHFEDCTHCKGTGLDPADPGKLCGECGGSGKVLKS